MAQHLAVWWDATDEDLRWGHDGIAPSYAIYFRKPVGGIMCLMALEAWRHYHQEMEQS